MKHFLTILLIVTFCGARAQDSLIFNDQFPFNDGIFLTTGEFVNNRSVKPADIARIYSSQGGQHKRNRAGKTWSMFEEWTHAHRSSITIDSIYIYQGDSDFKINVPGHNFFALKVEEKLFININPHKRSGKGQQPIFGRVASIGPLTLLYVEYLSDNSNPVYVRDEYGNMVKQEGGVASFKATIIYDLLKNRFDIATDRWIAQQLKSDEVVYDKYMNDKKRKKKIQFYIDMYNTRNPIYLPFNSSKS